MDKLLELTEKIESLRDISNDSTNGLREYNLQQGNAITSTVYQSKDVAIAIGIFGKGTIFPWHRHGVSLEQLTVYKGEITVITEEAKHTLKIGDTLILLPGQYHMLKVNEDSKMLITTIPPDFDAVARIISNGR
jgi:quercetin dioxygenase-like cupin family protein